MELKNDRYVFHNVFQTDLFIEEKPWKHVKYKVQIKFIIYSQTESTNGRMCDVLSLKCVNYFSQVTACTDFLLFH